MGSEAEADPPLEIPVHLKREVPELERLVSALTCSICYDPFNNPVITSCSHSYCNLCIRKFLLYKPLCPQCGTTVSESTLRLNRSVGEAALQLRQLVAKLGSLVSLSSSNTRVPQNDLKEPTAGSSATTGSLQAKEKRSGATTGSADSEQSTISQARNPAATGVPSPLTAEESSKAATGAKGSTGAATALGQVTALTKLREAESSIRDQEAFRIDSDDSDCESPAFLSQTRRVPASSASDSASSAVGSSSSNFDGSLKQHKVECMMCRVQVSRAKYNEHLNLCMDKAERPQKPPARRKPFPKLVYNLLKDNDLRKKCKEEGLSTKGDRKALISRHQKFTLLYNSECDMDNPRSKAELCQQVEREEAAEGRGSSSRSGSLVALLQFDRNTDSAAIESKQRQYIKENRSNFKELILKARLADGKKGAKTSEVQSSQSPPSPGETAAPAPPSSQLLVSPRPFASTAAFKDVTNIHNVTRDLCASTSNQLTEPLSVTQRNSRDDELNISTQNAASQRRGSGSEKQKSIIDSLARSVERQQVLSKISCPSCSTLVPEKFLNIHLDRCLRKNEPVEESPVLSKTRSKSRGKRQQQPRRPVGSFSADDGDDIDDFDEPQPAKRRRPLPMVISDSSDDGDDDDFVANDDSPSSFVVAEPSLDDLRNMGLVQDPEGSPSPASSSKPSSSIRNMESHSLNPKRSSTRSSVQPSSTFQQASQLSTSSVASNDLDNYTESLAQLSQDPASEVDMFLMDGIEDDDERPSSSYSTNVVDESLDRHIDLMTEKLLAAAATPRPAVEPRGRTRRYMPPSIPEVVLPEKRVTRRKK